MLVTVYCLCQYWFVHHGKSVNKIRIRRDINPIKRCFQSTRKHLNFPFASQTRRSDSYCSGAWHVCASNRARPTSHLIPPLFVFGIACSTRHDVDFITRTKPWWAPKCTRKYSAAPATILKFVSSVGAVSSWDLLEGEMVAPMNYERIRWRKKTTTS